MRGIIFSLTLLASSSVFAANMDPASQFAYDTMTRVQTVLAMKADNERFKGLCSMAKSKMAYSSIGYAWLGDFNKLAREKTAVKTFYKIVPSIVINKVFGASGKAADATFDVNPTAVDRGNGTYAVGLSVTYNGSKYNGTAVVLQVKNKFQLLDVEAFGVSAVAYLGRPYQQFLQNDYNQDPNSSMPVTDLVKSITSENGFMRCP